MCFRYSDGVYHVLEKFIYLLLPPVGNECIEIDIMNTAEFTGGPMCTPCRFIRLPLPQLGTKGNYKSIKCVSVSQIGYITCPTYSYICPFPGWEWIHWDRHNESCRVTDRTMCMPSQFIYLLLSWLRTKANCKLIKCVFISQIGYITCQTDS